MTPKLHWTLQGQKALNTCVFAVLESQISVALALQPIIFKLTAILHVHWTSPKFPKSQIFALCPTISDLLGMQYLSLLSEAHVKFAMWTAMVKFIKI